MNRNRGVDTGQCSQKRLPVNLNVSQERDVSMSAIKKTDRVYRRELNNTGGWGGDGERFHLCNGLKCPQLLAAQLRAPPFLSISLVLDTEMQK